MSDARERARYRLQRSGGNRRSGSGSGIPVRLVICGAVFVALVAAKLMFPAQAAGVMAAAKRLISQDADFKGAVEAMGRAISGEAAVSDSLQEAYAAVFNPGPSGGEPEAETGQEPNKDDAPEVKTGDTPEPETEPENGDNGVSIHKASAVWGPTGGYGKLVTPRLPAATQAPVREVTSAALDGEAAQDENTAAEALSYVYTMPALPENASLEQRNLGFLHTTPVEGTLSSSFGWREHPIDGDTRFHYGVDLAAARGSDVCAFADGTVYATGESSTLGNYIMLKHQGGYVTLYAHCSKVTATGGDVSMGDKIAEVGATGSATGPHLHFELHDGELYLNPIYYVAVG